MMITQLLIDGWQLANQAEPQTGTDLVRTIDDSLSFIRTRDLVKEDDLEEIRRELIKRIGSGEEPSIDIEAYKTALVISLGLSGGALSLIDSLFIAIIKTMAGQD